MAADFARFPQPEVHAAFAARGDDEAAGRLVILRHALMNAYLIDRENGIGHIDRYFDHLAAGVRALG